jgi:hypothetical protein
MDINTIIILLLLLIVLLYYIKSEGYKNGQPLKLPSYVSLYELEQQQNMNRG